MGFTGETGTNAELAGELRVRRPESRRMQRPGWSGVQRHLREGRHGARCGRRPAARIDCTRAAGTKVDIWWLRRHDHVRSLTFKPSVRRQERINWQIRYIEGGMDPVEEERFLEALGGPLGGVDRDERSSWLAQLDDVALASDGYVPFRDNIDQATRHGVRYLAHPGGSTRNDEVEAAAGEHGIEIVNTGIRLFHH